MGFCELDLVLYRTEFCGIWCLVLFVCVCFLWFGGLMFLFDFCCLGLDDWFGVFLGFSILLGFDVWVGFCYLHLV